MQKLLSLPPNLVQSFHELERVNRTDWFCTSDPVGKKLGSGGGTSWLLEECYNEYSDGATFGEWLEKEKRILLHAGGQRFSLRFLCSGGREGNIWDKICFLCNFPYMKKSCLWLRINSIH